MSLHGGDDSGMRIPSQLRLVETPRQCSYLSRETASLEYRVVRGLTSQQYGHLLARGWRRHGGLLFRPACANCVACQSLRIPVAEFAPTKSQRRTLRRNAGLTVELGPAHVTADHVRLYNAWHVERHARRGWSPQSTAELEYATSFLAGDYPGAMEMQYRLEGRLVAVSLVDVARCALSSVYFYYDPELRPAAPGVFSILKEVEICQQAGIDYLYLGYCIRECPSMAYKADYGPHEILERYVEDDEPPVWRRPEQAPTT
ncbi:MAG: arginyltransferase [Planctomyces sp.]|nr:arginyltransferase [Planctomyces sp.]